MYPPARHLLRDLCLSFAPGADGHSRRVWLPVVPGIRTDAGRGLVRMGAIATLVDVLGGGLAATAAAPDWFATADLTVHLGDTREPGDRIEAHGRVLRTGRTTVVMEVDLLRAVGTGLGIATMTFAVLPRRDSNPVMPAAPADEVTTMALPDSGLDGTLVDAIGVRIIDAAPGSVEAPVTDWVRNSMGALQGGAVATLAEVA
ncbi:MAG: PaaI family thioesterase, partial [Actinomycetota bacterium]